MKRGYIRTIVVKQYDIDVPNKHPQSTMVGWLVEGLIIHAQVKGGIAWTQHAGAVLNEMRPHLL